MRRGWCRMSIRRTGAGSQGRRRARRKSEASPRRSGWRWWRSRQRRSRYSVCTERNSTAREAVRGSSCGTGALTRGLEQAQSARIREVEEAEKELKEKLAEERERSERVEVGHEGVYAELDEARRELDGSVNSPPNSRLRLLTFHPRLPSLHYLHLSLLSHALQNAIAQPPLYELTFVLSGAVAVGRRRSSGSSGRYCANVVDDLHGGVTLA
eukprot:731060-Rhodomonas_salina.1